LKNKKLNDLTFWGVKNLFKTLILIIFYFVFHLIWAKNQAGLPLMPGLVTNTKLVLVAKPNSIKKKIKTTNANTQTTCRSNQIKGFYNKTDVIIEPHLSNVVVQKMCPPVEDNFK
jgi:uncharacterized membrane protein